MKSNRWVALAGGLGNQLYQYAYAITNTKDDELSILECVGFKLGEGKISDPDIAKFNTPNCTLSKHVWKVGSLERLSLNYLLRVSARRRLLKILDPAVFIAYLIVLPRISYASYSRSRGLNWPGNMSCSFLRVGYFQDVAISERAVLSMKRMSLLEPSPNVAKYIKYSKVESPLVVHIRRGDYLQDTKFGCLSEKYYKQAITDVWNESKHKRIWLFSDDSEFALRMIDQKYLKYVRVIEPTLSAAETFEIMRLGADYIIANSSYSYWAGRLRKNEEAQVHSPNRWFKKAYFSPKNTPKDWIIRIAEFE